jgi:hypothetical protein
MLDASLVKATFEVVLVGLCKEGMIVVITHSQDLDRITGQIAREGGISLFSGRKKRAHMRMFKVFSVL